MGLFEAFGPVNPDESQSHTEGTMAGGRAVRVCVCDASPLLSSPSSLFPSLSPYFSLSLSLSLHHASNFISGAMALLTNNQALLLFCILMCRVILSPGTRSHLAVYQPVAPRDQRGGAAKFRPSKNKNKTKKTDGFSSGTETQFESESKVHTLHYASALI